MLRRWLEHIEESIIAFILAAMTIVTFAQVVARYIFNYSFVWALELSMVLFGALIFLGMSYGVRVNAHIGVDAVVKALPRKAAHYAGILGALLCLAYAGIVFYGSWLYVSKMHLIGIMSQDLPIPLWVPRTVMPMGYFLLIWRLGEVLIRLLRGGHASLLGDEVEDAMKYRAEDDQED